MAELNCAICGSENAVKHHVNYAEDEVVPLCRSCHVNVHHDLSSEYYPVDGPRSEAITVRLTSRLKWAIDEYLKRGAAYISCGDLTRDALRDKLQSEVPEIYKGIIKKEED